MVSRRASREEIESFAADGWGFRVKPRKDKLYVSRRRKGDREWGLGRYSDEYWAMIQDVITSFKNKRESDGNMQTQIESKVVLNPSRLVWGELQDNMRYYKYMRCLHMEADQFCGYWLLEDLPRYGKQLSQEDLKLCFRKVNSVDMKTQAWAFTPTVGICSCCPYFTEGKEDKPLQFPPVRGQ